MSWSDGSQKTAEQIESIKCKIQLLEGDKKAYYEQSQLKMQENQKLIKELRQKNKELNQRRADKLKGDEKVVSGALEKNKTLQNALKNKSGVEAIQYLDEKCCDIRNKGNALRHTTSKKSKKLEELKTQHQQMEKDESDAQETASGDSAEAKRLRDLENQLDKARLKCSEAEHIQNTYHQIRAHMEQEHSTFPTILDKLEQDIKSLKKEKAELELMRNDALVARDLAKAELELQEKEIYREKHIREQELQQMRKEAEETRLQQEKMERRNAARAGSVQQEDTQTSQQQSITMEEEHQKITEYEDMFKVIKDATGVSDTQEVVTRFENQDDTERHLEELKKSNEREIVRLREEKERLEQEFSEKKYTGEAKMSSGQRVLEEFEEHLQKEEDRRDHIQNDLDKSSHTLTNVRSGVEHLTKKLHNIKPPSSQVQKAQISPTSDEYVLDQLSICEEKMLKLMEELDKHNLEELQQQMEEEEFHKTAESRVPANNTRVPIQPTNKDGYDDSDDSGEDEDIMTRANIKRQSQLLMESKNKRRRDRKKKAK